MIALLASVIASAALALMVAQVLGLSLGLLATRFRSVHHLSNLLTELRGSFGLSALSVLAIHRGWLGPPLAIGLAAGFAQAIAIARWTTRPSGTWAPQELGAMAMGESSARLAFLRGYRRGAVRATASLSILHCVALWAVVLEIFPQTHKSLDAAGPWLLAGSLALLFVGNEFITTRLLRRRTGRMDAGGAPGRNGVRLRP